MLKNTGKNKFDHLEKIVRDGQQTNCPEILYDYLLLGDQYARARPAVIKYKVYERMYRTLLETICDPLIATHWRHTCLDNINKPLLNIQKYARNCCEQQKVIYLYQELAIVSQYFL